jgi:two-component system, response regulator, stage 0 sporulation protein F
MEKTKILYVDDEVLNLELFKANLCRQYDVYTAESGMKGLEILSSHKDILIVVSDMKMPKMNGMEFIHLAQSQFPRVKYYILTGFDITNEILQALKEGVIQKYFRKPFNIKEIGAEMERVVTSS